MIRVVADGVENILVAQSSETDVQDGFTEIVNELKGFVAPPAWTTIRLPLAEFRPGFRGRAVPDAPPLDPARVRQVGLMIADRQAGPFALAIRSFAAA